jgi:hypothetical protein
MRKRPIFGFFPMGLSLLILLSCATPRLDEKPPEAPKIPPEEQQKLAMVKFKDMLEMTANAERTTILPQIEEGYHTIINKYPDAYLAEESYLRLIMMNIEDYYPYRVERAEQLYKEYFEKYPKPKLNNVINDTMARFYYRTYDWEKLAAFCLPFAKRYAETGELPSPLYMFFYSEAKFMLKEYDEAERGFRIILHRYKGSREAEIGEKKLEAIEKIKAEQK